MKLHVSNLEIFLIQVAGWITLWLSNSFLASLLTAVVVAVLLAVLGISSVSEWIEKSYVPRRYFMLMWLSVVAALTVALAWGLIFGEIIF